MKQGPDKRDGGSTLPVSHPRIRQSLASRGALFLWAIILSFLVMIVIAACQRSEEDGTAVVQLPVVPERPTGSSNENPGSATGYPEPIPGYPPGATPSPGSTSAYPGPPTPTPRPSFTPTSTAVAPSTLPFSSYLPFVWSPEEPTPTATPSPKPTSTPEPTPTPTIDFRAVRAQLQAEGQDLGFSKIGFHTGVGGNRTGLGDWMQRLDAAGVPFFIKTVDDSGPLVEAQEILRSSDVPHTLVYRRSGNQYDTPDYDLPPEEAARKHWQMHVEAFPVELDRNLVWLETINEPDKERSEWLGRFALETANLAMAEGFRWAAFGWSSGEPEATDWQTPSMQAFLRLAAANPDRLAVALHEYSFLNDNIADAYPFKVGRFLQLFDVVDSLGIARPTVLITEWGWEYQSVPDTSTALQDIDWAAAMYAPYPEVKGAAIWYLGNGFGGIASEAQSLIEPVTEYSLGTYFAIPISTNRASINPEQYRP